MKVLRILAPGTPPRLADAVRRAVVEFNRGLDIRLRFLSIGIEETVIEAADSAAASDAVTQAMRSTAPDVVVVLGEGAAALAAATAAVRERATLVRVGAGRREGSDADASRAIDRIASVLLHAGPAAAAALDAEGLTAHRIDIGDPGDPAAGERIVRALARARRAAQGGASPGGQLTC